jgi:hypothetical protein
MRHARGATAPQPGPASLPPKPACRERSLPVSFTPYPAASTGDVRPPMSSSRRRKELDDLDVHLPSQQLPLTTKYSALYG